MKKITVITGNQGVGKTTFVAKMTKDRKAIWLDYSKVKYATKYLDLDESTEVIIVDDVKFDKDMENIKALLTANTLSFRKPYVKHEISIPCPDLILISTQEIPAEARHLKNMTHITL